MSVLMKNLSYCCQLATRIASQACKTQQILGASTLTKQTVNCNINPAVMTTAVRWNSKWPTYKFEAPSPYRKPGPIRHGYQQKYFDGGRLPRGVPDQINALKPYRPKNRWDKKHALFGQNDYIDILGDSGIRPADLLQGPRWVRGFNGNEMQRLSRRFNMEGYKIKQLYPSKYHSMWKRMRFLYKKYNMRRGKALPGPNKWRPS